MPQRTATIESLPMAFEVVKAMQADGLDWDVDYRPSARAALAEIIELQMAAAVDRHLTPMITDPESGQRADPCPEANGSRTNDDRTPVPDRLHPQ